MKNSNPVNSQESQAKMLMTEEDTVDKVYMYYTHFL